MRRLCGSVYLLLISAGMLVVCLCFLAILLPLQWLGAVKR